MIAYIKGDATKPGTQGTSVIAHICNNKGAWGAGFVMSLSRRWLQPEADYREMTRRRLGDVIFVTVETKTVSSLGHLSSKPSIVVANMIAQDGFPTRDRPVAVDYKALEVCLDRVAALCRDVEASLHMPRIGCGIGGGSWDVVQEIIVRTVCSKGVPVFVYDYVPGCAADYERASAALAKVKSDG